VCLGRLKSGSPHAWVLLRTDRLTGVNGNADNSSFAFIEPTTGVRYPAAALQTHPYQGVGAAFNASHLYVNKQHEHPGALPSLELQDAGLWQPLKLESLGDAVAALAPVW